MYLNIFDWGVVVLVPLDRKSGSWECIGKDGVEDLIARIGDLDAGYGHCVHILALLDQGQD